MDHDQSHAALEAEVERRERDIETLRERTKASFMNERDLRKSAEAALSALRETVEAVRAPVRWFAEQMESKLREHDDRDGWYDCDWQWLLSRLRDEVQELQTVLACMSGFGHDQYAKKVINEASDVANFAMMIADNTRRALGGDTGSGEGGDDGRS